MLVSSEITGVSPEFTLTRFGLSLEAVLDYRQSGYFDEESELYLWDGDLGANIGDDSDYQYQGDDAPMHIEFEADLQSGVAEDGNYTVNDFYDGTSVSYDFKVILFEYGSSATYAGTASNDLIFGADRSDALSGAAGADVFEADAGNDVMNGGAGGDRMDGGAGSDSASYAGASARVTASLGNPSINTGDAAGDVYISVENLVGSSYNDSLNGDNSANMIKGGAGQDLIKGGGGNDRLFGNAGRDGFIFNTSPNASTNVDKIEDFVVADDTIWLENAVYDAIAGGTGYLSAGQFVKNNTGVAADANDRIIYDINDGRLYYDINGSAGGGKTLFATLGANLNLTANDFYVI